MTLSPLFSGSKPQRGEDRVGGGRLGLPSDPVLHSCEPLCGLMDIVAVGDIGEGLEQLFETLGAAKNRRRTDHPASRRAHHRPHCSVSPHPSAFLRGPVRIRHASAA